LGARRRSALERSCALKRSAAARPFSTCNIVCKKLQHSILAICIAVCANVLMADLADLLIRCISHNERQFGCPHVCEKLLEQTCLYTLELVEQHLGSMLGYVEAEKDQQASQELAVALLGQLLESATSKHMRYTTSRGEPSEKFGYLEILLTRFEMKLHIV